MKRANANDAGERNAATNSEVKCYRCNHKFESLLDWIQKLEKCDCKNKEK